MAKRFSNYGAAHRALMSELSREGWRLSSPSLRVPHATAPSGNVRLWFKSRSIYEGGSRPNLSVTGESVDVRTRWGFERMLDYARRRARGASTAGVFRR